MLECAKILSIPHEGMLRYTTPAFAILVSFSEIVQLVFSQLSNIDVSHDLRRISTSHVETTGSATHLSRAT